VRTKSTSCSQSVRYIYGLENGLNKGCSHCSHCSHSNLSQQIT
jgi:hypothetical protein